MCGIVGIARFDGRSVGHDEIHEMVGTLVHRGPDDAGVLVERGVGLGMRRLSILDLSPLGHQPMGNEDGAVQLVYNGEIYNFRELRRNLIDRGHTFRSTSDTEVIVHGYEEHGAVELARRLEGMYAFALLDRRRGKLFLARGPFGIKPLYLRRGPGQLSFASEIRALAHDGQGAPGPAPDFVGSYLCLGYIPSPATAFRDVTRLETATVLEVDLASGAEVAHRFYELNPERSVARDEGELCEALRERLAAAVDRHLIADVPMGVFLSGGLDSSALATLAARRRRDATDSGTSLGELGRVVPPRTFSVGFARSDRGDETGFAAEVARRLGVENVRIELAPNALSDLDTIVASLEEPLSDSAVLPLWHLCKGTSAHVKAALSGEGGDEVLGGYHRYFWGQVTNRLGPAAGLAGPAASLFKRAAGLLPAQSKGPLNFVRRSAKLAGSLALPESARYMSWFEIFPAAERAALGHPSAEPCAARFDELFRRAHALGLDAVQRQQYVDFSSMLLDNLLMKADKLSMAHSLEVRVPFLDRPLVELGLGLPMAAKVGARRDKPLLRRLLARELPASITDRPKRGFEIPVDAWFRDSSTAELRARLTSGALVRALGLPAPAVSSVLDRHLGGEDLGRQLFSLLSLELWAKRFA